MITKPKRDMPADFAETIARIGGIKETMRHYRAGPKTFARWIAEAGLNPKDYHKPTTGGQRKCPDDFSEMAARMSRMELSKHYKVGDVVLSRWMKAHGIKGKTSTGPRRGVPEDFLLLAPTMFRYQLKDHYSTSSEVLLRWIEQTGVQTRKEPQKTPKPKPFHVSLRTDGGRGQNFTVTKTWTVHDLAADELRRNGWPVHRCDERGRYAERGKFWRAGNVVCTPDELLTRAERYRKKAA